MKQVALFLIAFALLACSDDTSIYSPKSDTESMAVYDTPCENGKVVDYRDGRTYKCFTITERKITWKARKWVGERYYDTTDSMYVPMQSWMTENLNFGTFVKGTKTQGNATWESAEKYCRNDQLSSCDAEGGLYQWHTAMALKSKYDNSSVLINERRRGICPGGWHVPDEAEWDELDLILKHSEAALCDSLNGKVGWAAVWENSRKNAELNFNSMCEELRGCSDGTNPLACITRAQRRDQAGFVRCVKD